MEHIYVTHFTFDDNMSPQCLANPNYIELKAICSMLNITHCMLYNRILFKHSYT